MSEKIKAHHLERGGYVYVRQSTPQQVRNHLESKERQYALASRAEQLGFHKVVVIDDDLGRSGTGMQERPGFGRLLASVCQGLAGAVFALEASRLARNNRDWHHLVDLCAMTETLLVDNDGIYDPRQLNDRLILGLKGTMSEFELGLLRQRAREAFEQKVRRGFALWEVPVGFIRSEEGRIEKRRTARFSRRSPRSSRNSGSWEARGKPPSGSGKSKFLCRKRNRARPGRR